MKNQKIISGILIVLVGILAVLMFVVLAEAQEKPSKPLKLPGWINWDVLPTDLQTKIYNDMKTSGYLSTETIEQIKKIQSKIKEEKAKVCSIDIKDNKIIITRSSKAKSSDYWINLVIKEENSVSKRNKLMVNEKVEFDYPYFEEGHEYTITAIGSYESPPTGRLGISIPTTKAFECTKSYVVLRALDKQAISQRINLLKKWKNFLSGTYIKKYPDKEKYVNNIITNIDKLITHYENKLK